MDDDVALRNALRTYVTANEPPAGLTGAAVLAGGRRSRRARRVAGLGGLLVGVIVVTGALGWVRQSSAPALYESGVTVLDTTACRSATPGMQDPADRRERITCYLATVLPERLPGVTFHRMYGPAGTAPLEAYPSDQALGGFDANAVITDARGTGSVLFVVSESSGPGSAPSAAACASKGICTLRTGPHGETIEVYTSEAGPGADDEGKLVITLYVYTGRTLIIAGTSNADERRYADSVSRPTRPEPPLTLEALIEIATAADLAVFS